MCFGKIISTVVCPPFRFFRDKINLLKRSTFLSLNNKNVLRIIDCIKQYLMILKTDWEKIDTLKKCVSLTPKHQPIPIPCYFFLSYRIIDKKFNKVTQPLHNFSISLQKQIILLTGNYKIILIFFIMFLS